MGFWVRDHAEMRQQVTVLGDGSEELYPVWDREVRGALWGDRRPHPLWMTARAQSRELKEWSLGSWTNTVGKALALPMAKPG